MATDTASAQFATFTVPIPPLQNGNLADLLARLGDVPPERIRSFPPPGCATEDDVVAIEARENRLYELVEGTLVEKAMGLPESFVAMRLGIALGSYVEAKNLGEVSGEGGMAKILPGVVRIPDLAFFSHERLAKVGFPEVAVPAVAPDLAVEILSSSNTPGEIRFKLAQYFQAGVRLVWIVDPKARKADIYRSPTSVRTIFEDGELDGEDVVPGFRVPLGKLLRRPKSDPRS
ncbi:MAG: Uma2 family endonuclease [Planctomycetia bacterium]|nr:Uma2 family endonuclease [Planctomycetia bacterium]